MGRSDFCALLLVKSFGQMKWEIAVAGVSCHPVSGGDPSACQPVMQRTLVKPDDKGAKGRLV
jgi:hypothetical protein